MFLTKEINLKISFGKLHTVKISSGLTMEDETKKELMEIERALEEEMTAVGEPSYKSDQLMAAESELPFFKKPLSPKDKLGSVKPFMEYYQACFFREQVLPAHLSTQAIKKIRAGLRMLRYFR